MSAHKLLLWLACIQLINSSIAAQDLSRTAIVADLPIYRNIIEDGHKNPYVVIDTAKFLRAINELKNKLDTLSGAQILVGLMQVNASIGDTHTRLMYEESTIFPLIFYKFKEGYYTVAADKSYQYLLLSKLVAIDGHSIDDLESRIKSIIPGTNRSFINYSLAEYLSDPLILFGLGIANNKDTAAYTLMKDGTTKTIKVISSPKKSLTISFAEPPRKMVRYSQKGNYWSTMLADVLYVKYNRCQEDKLHPFSSFMNSLLPAADQAKKVVIDLRDNFGGNERLLADYIPEFSKLPCSRNGQFYVLIGRKTFSSAASNAGALRKSAKAKLVGEETGGDQNHFGEIRPALLPNSGIELWYSTKYFEKEMGAEGGYKPDIAIEESILDFKKGKDVVLDYILQQ